MTTQANAVWTVDAYGRTIQQAANEFAETNWQSPRKATKVEPDGTFKLKDGVSTYRVWLERSSNPPVYVVTRL